MICPNCEKNLGKLSSTDRFCWFCGYEFTEDDIRNAANEPDNETGESPDDFKGDGGVGENIVNLGNVVCIIGVIASFIIGFFLPSIDDDLTLLGILIMGLGSLLSWLSTLLLRGFGQLVSDTAIIRQLLQNRK